LTILLNSYSPVAAVQSKESVRILSAMGQIPRCTVVAPSNSGEEVWWAHQDLNLEPTDYESAALTN
jgi:hypothetical protein